MQAIHIKGTGDSAKLELGENKIPELKKGEVLIEVHAAGVNRADLAQKAGRYPPPPGASEILGLEISGVVTEVAENVSRDWLGKRVCGLVSGGGYAEYASADSNMLLELPTDWSFDYAAAIPEAFLTAYTNLFFEGGLEKGEAVLIHGGASGVGTAAIQLAKAAEAFVFTTAGSAEKCKGCTELGADIAIDYKNEDFVEVIKNKSSKGVNLVLDMVGGSYLPRNLDCLSNKGRIVMISFIAGRIAELDLGKLQSKRARIIGSVLRARSNAEKANLNSEFMASFGKELLSGLVKPVIDRVFDWRQAEDAHQRMSHNEHFGKVILKIRP